MNIIGKLLKTEINSGYTFKTTHTVVARCPYYETWLLIVAKTYSLYPVVQYAYNLILFYIYKFMNHWKLYTNRRKNRRDNMQNYLDQNKYVSLLLHGKLK